MQRARRPSNVASPRDPPPPPPELGGAAAVTESVTEVAGELPATLEHNSVYVSVPTAAGFTVCVPLLAKAPVQLPEAVQPVVFAEDQVIVVEPPVTMEVEPRESVGTAGATAGISVAATSACTNP